MCYNDVAMSPLPKVIIELIPDPEYGGFTARIPDIPALGEGVTEEEAIADLKVGVQCYIDEYGLDETLSRIVAPSNIREMDFADVAHG